MDVAVCVACGECAVILDPARSTIQRRLWVAIQCQLFCFTRHADLQPDTVDREEEAPCYEECGACYFMLHACGFHLTRWKMSSTYSAYFSRPDMKWEDGWRFRRELPETNASIFLERDVMSLSAFQALTKPVKRDLIKHGLLLLEYARQWSITEGRHFLPVVAAILLLLGEANQLKIAPVQISRELHTSQACMSLRSKELKDALVRFAQKLPWGQDISGKTVHRHLPFLLQYLEVTRKLKKRGRDSEPGTFYPPNKKLK